MRTKPVLPTKAPLRFLSKAGMVQLQWSPDVRLVLKVDAQPLARWYQTDQAVQELDAESTLEALNWMQELYGSTFTQHLCQEILQAQKALLAPEILKQIEGQTIQRIYLDPQSDAIVYRLSESFHFVVNLATETPYAQFESQHDKHTVPLHHWQIIQQALIYQSAQADPRHLETVLSDLMGITTSL